MLLSEGKVSMQENGLRVDDDVSKERSPEIKEANDVLESICALHGLRAECSFPPLTPDTSVIQHRS